MRFVLIFALLAYISCYTASFGLWTWKRKNRLGAVMILFIAVMNMALPIYAVFFRD